MSYIDIVPVPVIILGCGRSGTSIFGELFEGLAGYTYHSEPAFAEVIAADFTRPHAFKVPRNSPGYDAKPGLSFPIDALLTVAPATTFFWIVRHPLDAICSLRIGIALNWGHHPRPPDWRDWLSRPLVEQCAHHWAFLNEAGFRQIEHRAVLMRFEEMIADPLTFARSICTEIGIDADREAAVVTQWAHRVQDTNNASFVEARTSRPYSRADHSVRVARWRENLTDDEVELAWPIVKRAAERFDYRKAK
jgi:hypothetical protein